MRTALVLIRNRLDRMGILLSGLCVLHCVAGIVLVAGFGLGGELLFAPSIHRIGLALATVIGGFTLLLGVLRHGDSRPLQLGLGGLAMMIAALIVGHGVAEAVLTIGGVSLLAWAHVRNLRISNCATCD